MASLNFKLHPKQMEVLQSPARFKVVAAGRRAGKSFLSAVTLLVEALKTKNEFGYDLKNRGVYYISPTFQQSKDIMWDLLKDLGSEVIEKSLENTGVIQLVNGRKIYLKGSDRPETLRGVALSYVVLDEYAFMKPDVWDLIVRPTLADVKGSALFIGTPDGKNHFYDLWLSADKEDEWEAFHFNSLDNPLLDPKEIEHARKTMSTDAFRQEFEASFAVSGGGAFRSSEFQYSETSPISSGSIYISVDPAGFTANDYGVKVKVSRLDEFAIAVVEVGTEGWFIHDIIHGRWSVREASLRIIRAAQEYRPVAVGIERGSLMNAIMPYLEDQMRRLRIYPRIEGLSHGNKKKTERILWSLQGRFQHGRIWFKKGADYVKPLTDQLLDFPNPMVHDDLIDALAYIDQISKVAYNTNMIEESFEALDPVAGY